MSSCPSGCAASRVPPREPCDGAPHGATTGVLGRHWQGGAGAGHAGVRPAGAARALYDQAWLNNPVRFGVSVDLPLVAGYQAHKAASAHDSVFYGALADIAPDAWGRSVIARDHAKRRRAARN